MNNSILVKVSACEHSVSIRTVSRARKSPQRFYIPLDKLTQLETQSGIIVRDISSFAVLRRSIAADTLEIQFTWLNGNENSLSGYEETVVLPYSRLMAFVWDSAMTGLANEWSVLSLGQGKISSRRF